MTEKEAIDIGSGVTILLQSILNPSTHADEAANTAIEFVKDLLRCHPKIREVVDFSFENYQPSDKDFEKKYDAHVAWLKFNKSLKN